MLKENERLKGSINTLKESNDFLTYRINEIEKSMSWKISQKIIGLSQNRLGSVLKKIIQKIVK